MQISSSTGFLQSLGIQQRPRTQADLPAQAGQGAATPVTAAQPASAATGVTGTAQTGAYNPSAPRGSLVNLRV